MGSSPIKQYEGGEEAKYVFWSSSGNSKCYIAWRCNMLTVLFGKEEI